MIAPIPPSMALGTLDPITASMAGQSASQAWASQNMSDPYDVGFGINNYTSNVPAISGHTENTVSDSEEVDPIDAFDEYVEDNPDSVSDVSGGVTIGSIVSSLAYSLMETEPEVGVKVVKAVMPVAVPLEKAYVAISQALGVSMDAAEMDVETKQKFANSIISGQGLIYDEASKLVKAWWDGVNILFPRKTVEAVENLIIDEGIVTGYTVYDNVAVPISTFSPDTPETYFGTSNLGNVYALNATGYTVKVSTIYYDGSIKLIFASEQHAEIFWIRAEGSVNRLGYNVRNTYTKDGKTVYYTEEYVGPNINNSFVLRDGNAILSNPYNAADIAWNMIYSSAGGEYPEGTSPSDATKYTSSNLPSAGGIEVSPTDTEDVVAISLPSDDDTIGSTTDPNGPTDDETADTLPPLPLPSPIPDTRPSNPDVPLVNSSVIDAALVDELVEELANTLDPQPPQSSGLIPVPFMPGTPIDPTDPSSGSEYPSIVPASGSGFIHVYNPTPAEFVSFGNWLWVTYADATIDKIWNNPFDGVLGAHELYATPLTDGTDNIRSGFLVCPTTAALVRQRYTEIDCGSIIIPEFYGNYLDYSPYSQAYVYLPFIGIVEVSIDDFVGHAVNIRYRIDAYNGSCIAMIYVAKQGYRNLCYQFAGNCAVEVPLAGGSQAAIKAGMMQAEAYATAGVQSAGLTGIAQALGGLAGGLAHGGLAGALGGLVSGAISGLANYGAAKIQAGATREAARVANKSSVQHSGTFGASYGAMGLKIPFVMIRNPIQVKVVNYNDDYGFPAHKRVIIGGCTGYLRVREVNVISAHATNEEKIAIEEALKAGVYVT